MSGSNVIQASETTVTSLASLNSGSTYYNTATTAIPSPAGSVTLNTLRATNGAVDTITMVGSDTINANAFMASANNGGLTIGSTAGVGTVAPLGSELFFYTPTGNGPIVVNANISAGANTVVKTGPSTLTLAGTNNTFGALVINQNTVTISSSAGLTAGAAVTLNGNGAMLNLTYATTGATYNNPITVNADSYVANSASATLAGNVTLNNNASLIVNNNAYVAAVTLSGAISGTGGVIFSGSAPSGVTTSVTISGNSPNTYTGLTQILGSANNGNGNVGVVLSKSSGNAILGNILLGKRYVGNATRLVPETLTLNDLGGDADQIADTATITFGGGDGPDAGSFNLNGYSETIGAVQSQGPGDGIIEAGGNTGGAVSTLTIGTTNLATSAATGYTGTGTYTFSGWIRDGSSGTLSVTKAGNYTQIFASPNTYSGTTALNGGILSVNYLANGGSASSIGGSTNAAANLVFGGGDLQYTGPTASTDRLFTLNAGGGTIDASGAGAVTFSNTGTTVASGNPTLTLTGSSTALNVLTPSLSGGVSLIKTGLGTWALAGSSSYTGGTTINQGVLQVSANSNLGASSGSINIGGGTLQFAAVFDPSARTINIGAGGATIDTQALTVTLANSIGNGGSGALTKVGAGALVLGGANTFTGGATVTSGTLAANNASGSATGSGNVSIASGATLGGNGFIVPLGVGGPLVTINSGAHLAPHAGTGSSASTLNINVGSSSSAAALSIANGVYFDYNFISGSSVCDRIAATGNVTLGSGIAGTESLTTPISQFSSISSSTRYTLISDTGGTLVDNIPDANWSLPGNSSLTFSISHDAGGVYLTVAPAVSTLTWTGANGTAWNTAAANWSAGAGNVAYSEGRARHLLRLRQRLQRSDYRQRRTAFRRHLQQYGRPRLHAHGRSDWRCRLAHSLDRQRWRDRGAGQRGQQLYRRHGCQLGHPATRRRCKRRVAGG